MEPNEMQEALASAVEEVLETMYFTTVLASSQGVAPPEAGGGSAALTAQLCFRGSPPGRFRVSVPTDLARTIAAGFLGREDTEVSDAQAAEVICELANMICGSVLSKLESEATFQLLRPELVQSEAPPNGAAASRWFDLGDGILAASLELQQVV